MKTNFTFYLKSSLMVLFLCLGLSSWGQTVTSNFGALSGDIDANISFTTQKNQAQTAPAWNTNSSELRLYFHSSGNGGSVTLHPAEGIVITNVILTSSTSPTVKYNVDGGSDETASGSGTYTISNIEANQSLRIRNANTTNTQLRLTGITVTYITATSCEASNIAFTDTTVNKDLLDPSFTQTATSLNATTAITYESSDELVATVNATTGEVTLVSVGTATITASQEAGEHSGVEYCAGTATYDVVVTTSIPVLTVSANSASFSGFAGGSTSTETITVEGFNLTGNIALALSGDTNFSINPTSLSSTGGEVTITYTPSATPATHSATLTVSNGLLSEVITLSGVTDEMPVGPCGEETFDNAALTDSYADGSFVGNDGITWTYGHSRDEDTFGIDGNGIMLRRASDSYLETTISGSVGTFSFDYRRAFTGTTDRQLELIVDGQQVATTPTFGSNDTVFNLSYDINTSETITIKIKNVGTATSNKQIVIDNITWTCYSPVTWTTDNEWSNVTGPTFANDVIIEGTLTVGELNNLDAKSLTVNGSLTIADGGVINLKGAITNNGSFIVENGGNLIQTADYTGSNNGSMTVKKNSSLIKHLDYTIWSSPVAGQGLQAFSPQTLDYRIYSYATTSDTWVQATGNFEAGRGYMFRAPNDFVTTPYIYNGEFNGVANNGDVTVNFTTVGTYQDLGNPYPSNIDVNQFWTANTGTATLYFWTNTNAWNTATQEYVGNNWATYSSIGGTAAVNGDKTPTNIIQTGQGFVVETNQVISSVTFDNTMRTADNTGVFFRSAAPQRHRMWLGLSNENMQLNQILVGYMDGATNNFDLGIDSRMFSYNGSALFSIIENETDQFTIQGRAMPFTSADVVPLGLKAISAGTFTISLTNFDGLFTEDQDIFLNDNLTQTQHNLKDGDYTFVSTEGTFLDRFEVVYTATMSINNPELANAWVIYNQDNNFNIEAQSFELKDVVVYDMLGRVIYQSAAEGNSHVITNLDSNAVMIVKITTTDGQEFSRKVAK